MKKTLLILSYTFLLITVKAQTSSAYKKGFHFSGGLNIAVSPWLTYPNDPAGVGVELQAEDRISKHFAVYGSTGYTNFFNKVYEYDANNHGRFKTYSGGFIPVLAGVKIYFNSNFFIGSIAGIAFINSKKNITFLNSYPTEKTAFDIQPQIGYTKNKFQANFGVNVFANDDVHFSIGILYNFK